MVERNANGQFAKGHSGGPGRPKKKREDRFMEITLSTVTFADWKDIVARAVSKAKTGDKDARKWLSDYLIGPPTQKHELTGAGGAALIPARAESALEKIYGDDNG